MKMPRYATVLFSIALLALQGCGPQDSPSPGTPEIKFVFPQDAAAFTANAVKGDWSVGPKVASVKVDGKLITCINEKGESSRCEIREGKALLALDWRVYAVLIGNGRVLRWSDGSGWTR